MAAVLAAIGALATTMTFAQVSFQNTVSTGVVDIYGEPKESVNCDFAGLYDEVNLGVRSERILAGINGKFGISRFEFGGSNEVGLSWVNDAAQIFKYGGYDWFIDFKALPFMTVIFSDDVYTYGSFLPVFNGNLETGNIGSDFGVLLNFLDNNLRVGVGVDFGIGNRTTSTSIEGATGAEATIKLNTDGTEVVDGGTLTPTKTKGTFEGNSVLYSSKKISATGFEVDLSDPKKAPGVNLGIEYTYKDIFSVGATGRNLLRLNGDFFKNSDYFALGVYGSYTGLRNVLITGGLSINDDGIFGDYFVVDGTLVSLGFAAGNLGFADGKGQLEIAFDFVTAILSTAIGSFENNYSGYDIYAALRGTYHFNQQWKLNLVVRGTGSIIYMLPALFEFNPGVTWQMNRHHSFGAGVDFLFTRAYYTVNFPLYWTYRM